MQLNSGTAGVPTYVIGVGGAGIDVITELRERTVESEQSQSHITVAAVDSDRATLDDVPAGVTKVYLGSDGGVVGDTCRLYPYLSDDLIIPADGANRLRNVGRYTLDSPSSPGFQSHFDTFSRRLEQFIDNQETSLSSEQQRYTVVVVASLAGGTGSGTLPLLLGMLDTIRNELTARKGVNIELVGIGIVPPLRFDPEYTAPPVDPVEYPNTYGALRNLATLFDADEHDPKTIPVYSTLSTSYPGDTGAAERGGDTGVEFELTSPPLDACWLVSTTPPTTVRSQVSRTVDVAPTVAETVCALSRYAAVDAVHGSWISTAGDTSVGTFGHATLSVPHQRLREYCEQKQRRTDKQARLKRFVEPKLTEQRTTRETLAAALETRPDTAAQSEIDWLERLSSSLDSDPDSVYNLVTAFDPEAVGDSLAALVSREGLRSGLVVGLALKRAVSAGPSTSIRSRGRRIVAALSSEYGVETAEHNSASLTERLKTQTSALEEQIERHRRQQENQSPGVRDLLPSVHPVLRSKRQQLAQKRRVLESEREKLVNVQLKLRALQRVEAVIDDKLRKIRDEIRARLADVDRELAYFVGERERLSREVAELDRNIRSLRNTLVHPSSDGKARYLALDREALSETTLDTVENKLSSIDAYQGYGLLANGEMIQNGLMRCYRDSRGWPPAVARHEQSAAVSSSYEKTLVLYHESNKSAVEAGLQSVTDPDTVRASSNPTAEFTNDPYCIEFVSLRYGGHPESLAGFHRLEEMATAGFLKSMSGAYRNPSQTLAYPKLYNNDSICMFD